MNDDNTPSTLGFTISVILCLIFSAFGFLNLGLYFGAKTATLNVDKICGEVPVFVDAVK